MILDLLHRDNWTKGCGYRDADDNQCSVENACKYCIMGAYWKLYNVHYDYTETDRVNLKKMADIIVSRWPERVEKFWRINDILFNFNDHQDTTWEDIEALLKEANV